MAHMTRGWFSLLILGTLLLPALVTLARPAAAAELDSGQTIAPAAPPPQVTEIFQRTWERTDRPVAEGRVNRTWMWGPSPTSSLQEPYDEAPGDERWVQYYDKTRMEDNAYRSDPPWDVTNGHLAWEMVAGLIQMGDVRFVDRPPAVIAIAGDPDPSAPTYATFKVVIRAPAMPVGHVITEEIISNGLVGSDPSLAEYGVTVAYDVPLTKHTVASVFWEFMNSTGLIYEDGQYVEGPLFPNPFFATGYPVTEAYWTRVQLKGVPTWVLVQVFERRVLTYTPTNPDGWKVESGNVGQHYLLWRYGEPQ